MNSAMKTLSAAWLGLLPALEVRAAPVTTGWTDLMSYIVPSDGTRSLGNYNSVFNTTRDTGSKIVYFDVAAGDNTTAQVYWWNGSAIVDSAGSATNGSGLAYGANPLQPNEAAIKPFKQAIGIIRNADGDGRLRTNGNLDFATVAGGYPDWFLFRRGQTHDTFDGHLNGGRSESEPMVIAAYGPPADGRAVIEPVFAMVSYNGNPRGTQAPFSANWPTSPQWQHEVMAGLEFRTALQHTNAQNGDSLAGGPPTLLVEDFKMVGNGFVYLPRKSVVRRGSISFRWNATQHNQAYFTEAPLAEATFEEVVFYKNGYKTDPRTNLDPRRDVFSRNIYQGGGAQMGHTYRGIISADGASGGPQMRYGGLIENSLILEGYWFSSTDSNGVGASWVATTGQTGQSAIVRDNVNLLYKYPTSVDPDSAGTSDVNAQPGSGYSLKAASFNAEVENNIVSGAMLRDELLGVPGGGYSLSPGSTVTYMGGVVYTHKGNAFRNNIAYRANQAMVLTIDPNSDWTAVTGNVVENNVFAGASPISGGAPGLADATQLVVRNNRFYADSPLPSAPWMGAGNTLAPQAGAAAAEGWPDPDRTLKRYVQEVLGLTLLDWSDDPWVAGTDGAYDPIGLKTFMAVATNMRRGGTMAAPSGGKPSWTEDYVWDDRYTAEAVVNWIRAGFGKPPVGSGGGGGGDTLPPAAPRNLRRR